MRCRGSSVKEAGRVPNRGGGAGGLPSPDPRGGAGAKQEAERNAGGDLGRSSPGAAHPTGKGDLPACGRRRTPNPRPEATQSPGSVPSPSGVRGQRRTLRALRGAGGTSGVCSSSESVRTLSGGLVLPAGSRSRWRLGGLPPVGVVVLRGGGFSTPGPLCVQ